MRSTPVITLSSGRCTEGGATAIHAISPVTDSKNPASHASTMESARACPRENPQTAPERVTITRRVTLYDAAYQSRHSARGFSVAVRLSAR